MLFRCQAIKVIVLPTYARGPYAWRKQTKGTKIRKSCRCTLRTSPGTSPALNVTGVRVGRRPVTGVITVASDNRSVKATPSGTCSCKDVHTLSRRSRRKLTKIHSQRFRLYVWPMQAILIQLSTFPLTLTTCMFEQEAAVFVSYLTMTSLSHTSTRVASLTTERTKATRHACMKDLGTYVYQIDLTSSVFTRAR